MVSFVVENPQTMSASQNVFVSETTMSSIIPNNSSSQKLPPGLISISKKNLLKNIDIINGGGGHRINAWVDSMRASSPTHLKSLPSSISSQHQLNSWIMQHPSALEMFERIIEASGGKQIVMFLDYDGTLSPIVDDPDKAFMSSKMRRTVKKLAKCFPTAIVTGRCIDKVYNFVKLAELYYAGSHGMDIIGPAKGFSRHKRVKQSLLYQPANDYLPMIDEVYKQLLEKTKSTPGVKVENHKFCASVHFRCVDEKKWSELVLQVRSVLKKFPTLKLTQGRKDLGTLTTFSRFTSATIGPTKMHLRCYETEAKALAFLSPSFPRTPMLRTLCKIHLR
ncbi:PREDICTED: probable trehalose-phosphate phosphatase I isoform X2 [Camelina sativa]|uniref:Trehalose 6-phosphate phosphatase n=1 Tax=Camelina sativa TaxID=90675 RepID=A0ABM0T9G7_CAMSA|nr:PREDICTED: probable trehalose-phosphate phosphatase I isoform X2 [Camelina sativa]